MGFFDHTIQGIKNNLKQKARGEVVRGVEKGIGSIIKRVKNRCPKCGKPITKKELKFCPYCGAKLVLVCPNSTCQRESPLRTKFCPYCGTELRKTEK